MCLDFEEVAEPRWVSISSPPICVVTNGLSLNPLLSLGFLTGWGWVPTSQKTFHLLSHGPGAMTTRFLLSFPNLFIAYYCDKNFVGSYCTSVEHLWPPFILSSIRSQLLSEFFLYARSCALYQRCCRIKWIQYHLCSYGAYSVVEDPSTTFIDRDFMGFPFSVEKINSTFQGVSS